MNLLLFCKKPRGEVHAVDIYLYCTQRRGCRINGDVEEVFVCVCWGGLAYSPDYSLLCFCVRPYVRA